MKVAVDSSSLAKRYVREVGSGQLQQFLQCASELAFCVILVPEIVSGLNRRRREGGLTDRDYRAAKRQLLDDVRDATLLQITPAVVSHSVKLLESNTLRAMDALHLASAVQWQADLFITSDRRQWKAAAGMDLPAEYVGPPDDSAGN
jgi:uncharacterized protein